MSYQHFSYSPLTAGKHTVGLAGDFTSWEIIPLEEIERNIHSVYRPASRVYQYKFIVDGNWIPDKTTLIRFLIILGG